MYVSFKDAHGKSSEIMAVISNKLKAIKVPIKLYKDKFND